MMDDCISRGDAYIELMKCKDFDTDRLYHGNHYLKIACDIIRSIPSADVVERKKGKWESYCFSDLTYKYRCSLCKRYHRARYDFCPSCGAEMGD